MCTRLFVKCILLLVGQGQKMGSSVSSDLVSLAQIPSSIITAIGLDSAPWPDQTILEDNATYDYIVVGGGTAGCVVSSRLAEDKNNSVLMLEYGGNPPISALIATLFILFPHSPMDYNYTSTRDEFAARGQNNFTMLTAGKMLGGSASLNHFIHVRGSPSDFDLWAKIAKDNSWKYENILPYFKKSERVDDDEIISRYREFHGTDGPMGITRQPEEVVVDIMKSFAEVGNPSVLDLNADKFVGYTQPQLMFDENKRQTPAYVYLNPVKDYPNFHVSKHTRVTRIIFEGNVAVAVEAVYKDKTYTLRARKEIILSAGVFNTPQLLMLSGIGPKEHLESFNITTLKDLPVGDNLIDQVSVTVVYKMKKYPLPIPNVPSQIPNLLTFPFPTLIGSVAFNKSRETCPNYQSFNLYFAHDLPYLTVACAIVFGLRNEICNKWQKQVISRDSLYSVLALLQPKSRGTVRLESADPFADPIITTGYYSDNEDLKEMVKIVKDFMTVGETKYFKEIGAKPVGLRLKECAGKKIGTDEYWKCYILQHTHSPYHYVGTCPMGKVVDGNLKVKGVQNLRVVDASIMPTIPRAAPNAAVIMVAEKAADIIKNDNRNS